jgi:hypothetical protein
VEACDVVSRSWLDHTGWRKAHNYRPNRDRIMIRQAPPTLAMQKVEGSSPFSRFKKTCKSPKF